MDMEQAPDPLMGGSQQEKPVERMWEYDMEHTRQ
jgi:hypothetical protein